MSRTPVDQQQRQDALNTQLSFICEAPAGSGKTELLTQRVLTLLSIVEQPEAILAITFTRKAAGEMRERILAALHRGCGELPEEAHAQTTWKLAQAALQRDAAMGWNILQNPSRLQIRTFDSLCAYLNQSLPLQASLGINLVTAENPNELYRKAVNRFLESIEDDTPWSSALTNLLFHLDNQQTRLSDLFIRLLASRDGWIPVVSDLPAERIRGILESYLAEILERKVQQLSDFLAPPLLAPEHQEALYSLCGFAAANMKREKPESPICDLQDLDMDRNWPQGDTAGQAIWHGLKALLLTQAGTIRSTVDKRCGFPASSEKGEKAVYKERKEAMKALLAHLKTVSGLEQALTQMEYWPTAQYSDGQWSILEDVITLLPILLAHLRMVFSQAQQVDFTEMSERAREALGEEDAPTDLTLRLDQRIEHLLVDEFQDTSFAQVELLNKLTMGWQQDDGRTLFCVGDAMQSIYGFRGAKVGLFLHCKEHGMANVPLRPLQLKSNFRSQGKMVRWINDTFAKAFPSQNDIAAGAVALSYADDFRDDLDGEPVQFYAVDSDAPLETEEDCITDIIQQTWANNAEATIAVLVRNRGHARAAVNACQRQGIRFRALDLVPLADSAVVQDALSLTKALLDPMDRIAWFSVLRAPWCGLTLNDLLALSEENGFSRQLPVLSILSELVTGDGHPGDEHSRSEQSRNEKARSYEVSSAAKHRLSSVYATLQTSFHQRNRLPLRNWVEGCWIALGGGACLQKPEDKENIARFWQMLQAFNQQGEYPSAVQLDEAVAKLFAAPDPEGDERLQIMTIHKSKGLEFDVVILPELHRKPRNKESELFIWTEQVGADGSDHWLMAPIHAVGSDKDSVYRYIQQEQKLKEQYEACRLLYVACTRAKQRMHILARLSKGKEGPWQTPPSGSLLSFIWPSLLYLAVQMDLPEDLGGQVEAQRKPLSLQRLPETWAGSRFAEGHFLDNYLLPAEYANQNISELLVGVDHPAPAALFGTFMHLVLQNYVEQKQFLNSVTQTEGVQEASWRILMLSLGLSAQEVDFYLPMATSSMLQVRENHFYREQLIGSTNLYAELDITQAADSTRLVVDLLCEKPGSTIIVDYKTSQPKEGQLKGDFLQSEMLQYQTILRQYAIAAKQLGYASIQVFLYFILIDEWLEVDIGSI